MSTTFYWIKALNMLIILPFFILEKVFLNESGVQLAQLVKLYMMPLVRF
jgi:hypothetical protein